MGFIDKAWRADDLVLLDTVPFTKGGFQNRNRIRTPRGAQWLTVPVLKRGNFGQLIHDVRIDNRTAPRWGEKSWRSIEQHYRRAPHFPAFAPAFEEIHGRRWERLVDVNVAILEALFTAFGVKTPVRLASELGLTGRKETLLLDLCLHLDATTYLSGVAGRVYLDEAPFREAGLGIRYQEFHHPVYQQCYEPFQPAMSSIDLLFNHGGASLDLLTSEQTPRLKQVFT